MQVAVDGAIFETFPDVRIGVVGVRDLAHEEGQDFQALLDDAQASLRADFFDVDVTNHPRIACWREAYRTFGAKPKKYPSSIENLIRRTLKGERLRPIHPLVDLYNVVSLRHVIPAGGEDVDCIRGDIRLAVAGADEPAVRLLGERDERPPKAGEVIYTDDVSAICRRWNWKEADRTKLTGETRNAVLVLEALPPVETGELEAALAELTGLIERYASARLETHVLDRHRPSAAI